MHGTTRVAAHAPPLRQPQPQDSSNCTRAESRTRRARSPSTTASSGATDSRHHERTTTHDDEKMLRAHKGTKPEMPIDGVRRHSGRPPRQRGVRLVPPMRAWLTQPHGRRYKAPPQPCALTTATCDAGPKEGCLAAAPRPTGRKGNGHRTTRKGKGHQTAPPFWTGQPGWQAPAPGGFWVGAARKSSPFWNGLELRR